MMKRLLAKLWYDESGAVVSTEYLMLGSVVAVGGASGMAAMRDAVTDEFHDLGQNIREVRQEYSTPSARGARGTAPKAQMTDPSNLGQLQFVPTTQCMNGLCASP